MAILIICPACDARYQLKAAFPPEGRKVRCAKCGHVWQAHPAEAQPAPPQPADAPQPAAAAQPAAPQPAAPVPPRPAPTPAATPAAPPVPDTPPQPAAAAQVPPPAATPPQSAPLPGQGMPVPPQAPPQAAPPPEMPPQAAPGATGPTGYPPVGEAGPAAPPLPPEPEAPTKGGLFGKLMGKAKPAAEAPPPEMAPPSDQMAPSSSSDDADASLDASFPGIDDSPEAADASLAAEAFGESLATASAETKKKKPPVVAIGWGILGVIVLGVLGLFFLAPQTTMSILPGASNLYSALGMQAGAQGLQFEGVRYGWTNASGQNVLEVQGSVRNTGSAAMSVPTVIIVLRDENGEEISEWTTEVGAAELGPDEDAPFLKQIPAPPSNVRSLKVRFAKAG